MWIFTWLEPGLKNQINDFSKTTIALHVNVRTSLPTRRKMNSSLLNIDLVRLCVYIVVDMIFFVLFAMRKIFIYMPALWGHKMF